MGKWVGGTVAVGGWDWGRWVDEREPEILSQHCCLVTTVY